MKNYEIINMKSVAYYSGLNGLEIKKIEDDYVTCVSNAWGGVKKVHHVKIYFPVNGSPFFRVKGYKIPLDECIRV